MDNKKTIRNLLICLGIPIIFILIIGILFSTQPKKEYPTSDIVYLFKDNKVTEYKLDFGSGKLELTLNEKYEGKTEVETSVASISLFLQSIEDYVEDYNTKNPDKPMKYTWKQASDNSIWLELLPNIILIGVFIGVWIYVMRKFSGSFGEVCQQFGFGNYF